MLTVFDQSIKVCKPLKRTTPSPILSSPFQALWVEMSLKPLSYVSLWVMWPVRVVDPVPHIVTIQTNNLGALVSPGLKVHILKYQINFQKVTLFSILLDSLQEKQSLHQPLSWRFPDPPAEEEPRFPPTFELKTPTAADSVVVICLENSVRVEAKKDLLGTGRPVHVTDLTLGGCPATREDPATQVLIFESELHECGSQLTVRAQGVTTLWLSRGLRLFLYITLKMYLSELNPTFLRCSCSPAYLNLKNDHAEK